MASLRYTSSPALNQLLSVPPFFVSFVYTIVVGILSDRLHLRGPFMLLNSLISLIGYGMAYGTNDPHTGYAAAILAATGVYASVPIGLAWFGGNAGGEVKRAVVFALNIGVGNLGG